MSSFRIQALLCCAVLAGSAATALSAPSPLAAPRLVTSTIGPPPTGYPALWGVVTARVSMTITRPGAEVLTETGGIRSARAVLELTDGRTRIRIPDSTLLAPDAARTGTAIFYFPITTAAVRRFPADALLRGNLRAGVAGTRLRAITTNATEGSRSHMLGLWNMRCRLNAQGVCWRSNGYTMAPPMRLVGQMEHTAGDGRRMLSSAVACVHFTGPDHAGPTVTVARIDSREWDDGRQLWTYPGPRPAWISVTSTGNMRHDGEDYSGPGRANTWNGAWQAPPGRDVTMAGSFWMNADEIGRGSVGYLGEPAGDILQFVTVTSDGSSRC